jgi:endonuclease YncB( thermonuclease family)
MRAKDWFFHACEIPFPTTTWRCHIVNNADGDTATLYVDRGWYDLTMMEIRLADIDTYEIRSGTEAQKAIGRDAAEMLKRLAVHRWGLLTTHMDPEKYGRILGTISYRAEDGTLHDITAELRAAGYEKR